MKLTYMAHACFLLEVNGLQIVFDPYKYHSFSGAVGYDKLNVSADIVLLSHHHDDHAGIEEISGQFDVIDSEGEWEYDGMKIKGVLSYHDPENGKLRGKNTVFIVSTETCSVAHLGDQGVVDANVINELSNVDLVMVPVGGTYTLGPKEACEFITQLKAPKTIVPMHYKTPKLGFPIKGVDEFLTVCSSIPSIEVGSSQVQVEDILEQENKKIVVMKMAKL